MVTGMCGGFRNFIVIKLAELEMSRMREPFTMGGTRHLVHGWWAGASAACLESHNKT